MATGNAVYLGQRIVNSGEWVDAAKGQPGCIGMKTASNEQRKQQIVASVSFFCLATPLTLSHQRFLPYRSTIFFVSQE